MTLRQTRNVAVAAGLMLASFLPFTIRRGGHFGCSRRSRSPALLLCIRQGSALFGCPPPRVGPGHHPHAR